MLLAELGAPLEGVQASSHRAARIHERYCQRAGLKAFSMKAGNSGRTSQDAITTITGGGCWTCFSTGGEIKDAKAANG